MSLLCCCLCLQTLPTDRRKRKKLNGTGCTRAREVLTSMSTSSHECLEIMLQNGDAALCINCDSVLINISKYEQKLESLKKDMMEKVSIVMDQGLHSSSTLSAGKRPASKEVMPQTKNARIGSTPSSSAQPSPVLTVASTIPTSQEPEQCHCFFLFFFKFVIAKILGTLTDSCLHIHCNQLVTWN